MEDSRVAKTAEQLAEKFDFSDPDTVETLYEVYDVLREKSSVVYSPVFDGHWAVTRYETLVELAKDTKTFSSAQGSTIPDVGLTTRSIPLELDPPDHTPYRRYLGPRFRKASVDTMEPSFRGIVQTCLDRFRENGEADLVHELCERVPSIVIAQMLGLPEEDWDQFRAWTTAIQKTAYSGDTEGNARAAGALGGYLMAAIDSRRGLEDDGGVLWQLANESIDGEPIPTEKGLGIAILILMAGHETTASAGASMAYHLADKPELRARLLAEDGLIEKFINEMLRLEAPVTGMRRTVTTPVTVDGNDLVPGDKMLMLFSAANHDPAVYSNPNEFDLDRKERSHLAFGYGAHRCLGESVAILELKCLLQELLVTLPDYALKPGTVVEHTPGIARGPKALPVVFTPSSPKPADENAPSGVED
jgi:cytochrome P450